jgi:hypothetical protein
MLTLLGHVEDPAQTLSECGDGVWHLTFTHVPFYAADSSALTIHALFELGPGIAGISLFEQAEGKPNTPDSIASVKTWTAEQHLPYLDFKLPWPLGIHREPKPWGAEIWYTGIEARGVCTAAGMPLPWLLQCLPGEIVGSSSNAAPLLLKILDPLPNPSLGDLYFELHDTKIEVYVVTNVDTQVWPNGLGKIRYGFNQSSRSKYENDAEFKAAYLESVHSYEACRAEIDALLDRQRAEHGIGHSTAVAPSLMTEWLSLISNELSEQEVTLKAEMEAFTHLREIRVGDVIKVEPFFPHSLQHGVRVIEFQTASYERLILSFGQKVLTQDHWDTEAALDAAILDMPPSDASEHQSIAMGVSSEIIADFSAFQARRLTFEAGSELKLENQSDYQLMICAAGEVNFGASSLSQEQACFVPRNEVPLALRCDSSSVLIVAEPRASGA